MTISDLEKIISDLRKECVSLNIRDLPSDPRGYDELNQIKTFSLSHISSDEEEDDIFKVYIFTLVNDSQYFKKRYQEILTTDLSLTNLGFKKEILDFKINENPSEIYIKRFRSSVGKLMEIDIINNINDDNNKCSLLILKYLQAQDQLSVMLNRISTKYPFPKTLSSDNKSPNDNLYKDNVISIDKLKK